MSKIRASDTKPEMIVRRLAFSLNYRYRVHVKELPGKPDIVFKRKKKVIFVNGCFWHMHSGCQKSRVPKSRLEYWIPKLESNRLRDRINQEKLEAAGWQVLTIWECETKNIESLACRIRNFLGNTAS